jgi:hypothetical protein
MRTILRLTSLALAPRSCAAQARDGPSPTFVLAIPGDFTSAADTLTGENIYRTPTGQFVLQAVGRQVFNFDQSQLVSSHGPNAFVAAFYEGDPHVFDQICAALAA